MLTILFDFPVSASISHISWGSFPPFLRACICENGQPEETFHFGIRPAPIWNYQAKISHSNWDFDNAIVGDNKTFQSEEESEQLQVQPLIETDAAAGPSHTGRPGGGDGDGGPPGGDDDGNHNSSSDSDDSFDGCPHCFCDPCVTTHRQGWLGNAVPHNDRNPSLRKIRYKKFWTMLDRRQAWINPRYQRKKSRL